MHNRYDQVLQHGSMLHVSSSVCQGHFMLGLKHISVC